MKSLLYVFLSIAELELVKQHHWLCGNMSPQSPTGFNDMTNLMVFLREVQLSNGVIWQEQRIL